MKTRSLRNFVIGLFVYWIVAYGSIQILAHYDGETSAWGILLTTIFSGALFAGAIGVMLGSWQRKAGYNGIPTPEQSADVRVEGDVESTARKVEEALNNMRAKRINVSGTSPVIVTASTRMTWKSFGEKVSVSIDPTDNAGSSVHMETRPVLSMTLVDYGKGLDNLRRISEALSGA